MRIEPISDWILSVPPRVDHEYKVLLDVTTGNKYNITIYKIEVPNCGSVKWALHFPPITSIAEAIDLFDMFLNKYHKLKAFL